MHPPVSTFHRTNQALRSRTSRGGCYVLACSRVSLAGFGALCALCALGPNLARGADRAGVRVLYVDGDAAGADDGTSWENAWTDLQDALDEAEPGVHIWVATGTYRPGINRSATFLLLDDVTICGGFAGTEDPAAFDLNDRDFGVNPSVLDGNIGGDGSADNIIHVLTSSDTSTSAVLDGFTITGGYANGATSLNQDVGGGMLNVGGSPTIRRCIFTGNNAGGKGGAIYNSGGSPALVNCIFVDNRSTACQPSNPLVNRGGAIYSAGAIGNVASPTLVGCLFIGNKGGVGCGGSGGAIYNYSYSAIALTNCTFSANTADNHGGGIAVSSGSATLKNCILWGNSDSTGMGQPAQLYGSATVTYGCIQGGWLGEGNTEDEPSFANPQGLDGIAGTEDDNLRLLPGSPCIDAGDNTALVPAVPHDLDGNPRIVDDPNTPNTGAPLSANAIVDMGSYEYQEPCEDDGDCDDGDPCTNDSCDEMTGQCSYQAVDCDDGLYCNGVETCVGGTCRDGSPPDCDDSVECTIDTCSEAAASCDNEPDDSLCDNGDYCDGAEICHSGLGCRAGNAPCSGQMCDEVNDTCVDCLTDADCSDGLFCNGSEKCEGGVCAAGAAVVCNDDLPCTDDTCDETTDSCRHVADDARCDNGVYCDGVETCDQVLGCLAGVVPCTEPLVCDEESDACVGCLDDSNCNDGEFCNGAEKCVGGACEDGPSPCADTEICDEDDDVCRSQPECHVDADCLDLNPCSDDICSLGICEHLDNTAWCDDGNVCTDSDVCSDGTCSGTPIPGCGEVPNRPTDSDGDGVIDGSDQCPGTPSGESVGANGCSCSQLDDDGDGTDNCDDGCPADPDKIDPGQCGCGTKDTDSDGDGAADCVDGCPEDPDKTERGLCGCGNSDIDSDDDGTPDCDDSCPADPDKTVPGLCGCGIQEIDTDEDGTPDCRDMCPNDPKKTAVGSCGCGAADDDSDGDGVVDCEDLCLDTPEGAEVDAGGCLFEPPARQPAPDDDGDGVPDTADLCPGSAPGSDVDEDGCPTNPLAEEPSASVFVRPSCGACGAFGPVSWSLMIMGLLGLRAWRGARGHP